MSARHWILLAAAFVLLAAVLVLCLSTRGSPAESRVRGYFAISAKTKLDPESIRAAFLERIPLGSKESDVRQRIQSAGIGQDGLSSYSAAVNGKAFIRIEFDPAELNFVKKSYGINLDFDKDDTLQGLVVNERLTGP